MSSTDELREVEVEIKGNEHEAQHGHQMSMGDRDPTSMNDHVKVRKKSRNSNVSLHLIHSFLRDTSERTSKISTYICAQMISRPCETTVRCFLLNGYMLWFIPQTIRQILFAFCPPNWAVL